VAADHVAPAESAAVVATGGIAVSDRAGLAATGVVAFTVGAGIGKAGGVPVAVLVAFGAVGGVAVLRPLAGAGVERPAARAGRIGLGGRRDGQAQRKCERDKLEGVGDGAVLHGLSPCWMNVIHSWMSCGCRRPVRAAGAQSTSAGACGGRAPRAGWPRANAGPSIHAKWRRGLTGGCRLFRAASAVAL